MSPPVTSRPASSRLRADLTADAVRAIDTAGFHYESTFDDEAAVDGDGPPYRLDHTFVADATGATVTVQVKTDITPEMAASAGAQPRDDVASAIGSTWVGLFAPIPQGPNQGENGLVVEMSDGAIWFVGRDASPGDLSEFAKGFFASLG